ncbi:MAG: helix-turn-helix domain-containing protein [Clostridiales bacterium]|nr:helix-turn-helix domain-containing protein [Candidatus Cacconaster stercorequi]
MSRMTLSDRIRIEAGIYGKLSLSEIAKKIQKSPRYVSEEIKRNRTLIAGYHPCGKDCRLSSGCKRVGLCSKEGCHHRCMTCQEIDCQTICKAYDTHPCPILAKPPYGTWCTRKGKVDADASVRRAELDADFPDARWHGGNRGGTVRLVCSIRSKQHGKAGSDRTTALAG